MSRADTAPRAADPEFWSGKRVFLTGHTGFKGAWLVQWLRELGATVHGYALAPPTSPSLHDLCRLDRAARSTIEDVRDRDALAAALRAARPEIVFHLAAQSLVRHAYAFPVETFETNVLGTVNLLEAVRACDDVRAVVVVTTDKCYENREWPWAYRENEALGGRDPYSASKAGAELVTAAYRASYFVPGRRDGHGAGIATARAGNVIGGGDFSADRLLPDCVRAILAGAPVRVRNPAAIRPWQHVLEPLSGYLLLARRLFEEGARFAGAWNFGPADDDARDVGWVVREFCARWGEGASHALDTSTHPHEAGVLRLDSTRARTELGWRPRWGLPEALDRVVAWTRAWRAGQDPAAACRAQIADYARLAAGGRS